MMYRTCLFCARDLGSNEAIEHFPVGRRLAFDPERGRLWVICPSCTRWNLTPLEERWEAIEEAERLFRATRLRASTEHIGLARISEGTDLVRIGRPQRPEIAAWRYGTQFARRRQRHLIVSSVVAATAAAGIVAMTGGVPAAIGIFGIVQIGSAAYRIVQRGPSGSAVARFKGDLGNRIVVQRDELAHTTISADDSGELALYIQRWPTGIYLRGDRARRAASSIFTAVNRAGGSADEVESALGRLERAGSAERFLRDVARRGRKLSRVTDGVSDLSFFGKREDRDNSGLLALSTPLGLAIEMALHEDQERRALEGELAELEAAWKDAEEIGAISDSLLLPRGIDAAIARLKGK